jgi:hypothetical protein
MVILLAEALDCHSKAIKRSVLHPGDYVHILVTGASGGMDRSSKKPWLALHIRALPKSYSFHFKKVQD